MTFTLAFSAFIVIFILGNIIAKYMDKKWAEPTGGWFKPTRKLQSGINTISRKV